jgi:cysteine desulfurase
MIYLDHAASTPLDPEVLTAMQACWASPAGIGNPSAVTHAYGRAAAEAIDEARSELAALIGVDTQGIIFTSGATESNNLALQGLARGRADFGRHGVSSRTEHKAVLEVLQSLSKQGHTISWIEPQRDGRISSMDVVSRLRADTQWVSIMHANNETGVIQDIAQFAALCRERDIFFHCDAAQSVGKLPIEADKWGIDLLSISAHKFYGPKGIGALYVSERVRPWLMPLMRGGSQERGLRPGTLPTVQIVGLGVAARRARALRESDTLHLNLLVKEFKNKLSTLSGLKFNDHPLYALPGLISLTVEGVQGESLLAALSELALSTGAACDSTTGEPSYVLRAQGVSTQWAQSTLRISFGRGNTREEAIEAAQAIAKAVPRLRERDQPGAPPQRGSIPWQAGEAGSLGEGCRVRCYLQRDVAGKIHALEFRAFVCPDIQRVLDDLATLLPGQWVESLNVGSPAQWAERYHIPAEKLGRLLCVEDAVRQACK